MHSDWQPRSGFDKWAPWLVALVIIVLLLL